MQFFISEQRLAEQLGGVMQQCQERAGNGPVSASHGMTLFLECACDDLVVACWRAILWSSPRAIATTTKRAQEDMSNLSCSLEFTKNSRHDDTEVKDELTAQGQNQAVQGPVLGPSVRASQVKAINVAPFLEAYTLLITAPS